MNHASFCEQIALSGLAVAVIRWTTRPDMVSIVISAELQLGKVSGVCISTVGDPAPPYQTAG